MKYSSNTYTFLFVHQMNMDKQIYGKWLSTYVRENKKPIKDNCELGCIYDYDSDDEADAEEEMDDKRALDILIEILNDDDDDDD